MKYFSNLIERQQNPVLSVDIHGQIEYVNIAFENIAGLKSEKCIGKKLNQFFEKKDAKALSKGLKNILSGADEASLYISLKSENATSIAVHLTLYPEKDLNKLTGISGILKLISLNEGDLETDSNFKSLNLIDVEQRYKTLYNLTFEGIIIHSNGNVVDTNPSFARMMGYNREDLIGLNIITTCVLPEYHQMVIEAMQNEVTSPYEVLARTFDGTVIHTEVESRRVNPDDPNLRVTAIRNVTARKIAEKQLKESEERYKLLSNLTFEGIFLHDKGILLDVNQSFVNMLGYSAEELIGKNIIQLVVLPEYHARVIEALKNEETSPYEVRAKRKDGSLFYAEVESGMVNHQGKLLRVTAARDITWRKDAEKKLQENEEELDLFFSRSGDGFFIMKLDEPIFWNDQIDLEKALKNFYSKMYITKINDALLSQFGASREQLHKLTPEKFFSWNKNIGISFSKDFLNQGSIVFEAQEPRMDGTFMWVEGNYVMLYDDQGKIRGCCGVRRDITDRKTAEEAVHIHNEELKKANQELDNFVYRVSHDLKAPISSALGLINVARLETKPESVAVCLQLIEKSMNKLDSFILDILDYSRNSRTEILILLINFNALIDDVLSGIRFLKDERKVGIRREINADTPFYSDKRRLIFIFNNLISNAIRFSDQEKPNSELLISIDIFEKHAQIRFNDNGIGIADEHIDHIFDMFYRASETMVGSGLGLYIVKEAIEKLSGSIKVSSTPNQGTTFEMIIPNNPPQ